MGAGIIPIPQRLLDDDGRCAALQRLWDEGTPIGVEAVDGEKQATRLHCARVVGDRCDLNIGRAADLRGGQAGQELLEAHGNDLCLAAYNNF